jgi:DNA-binding MarR family transcriptional regulator
MERLEEVIFYTLDKAIKTYRQFAQRRLNEAGFDISIDQWLVLQAISETPGISQLEIAERVFKDAASITRIIDLLINKNYLQRENHSIDRRRFNLTVTAEGKALMKSVGKVVRQNRLMAVENISEQQLLQSRQTLTQIIENCSTQKLNS